ncbi:hypothetical protein FOZ62_031986 [Perkinsus olseni]|uniref:Uncharacterized protein n=1 Tax=Perkinsus olseni TaxID=32597 RepID=A0A7J6QGG8_PEROL|nr:hypothetical protein FOZ62_031986 [Perkinsus olseni]
MLWRVVYRDTEDHPDPKDFPSHTCDNTRCTLWRSRRFRDAFVCDETGHVHECNGRTMEDSACDSAMWDRENQCWVCPISMRIFRYAAPRNAAVEQGIEPGGEDFGPIHQAVEDSRGIVDPRAGEGECGEVEGQVASWTGITKATRHPWPMSVVKLRRSEEISKEWERLVFGGPHYGVIVAKEAKTPGGSDLIHKEAPIPTMVTTTQDRKGPVFCAVCFD